MDYRIFESKFEYPELAVIDLLMQKSDLFGDERNMLFYRRYKEPLYCLTFKNGSKYLAINGRCNLFVAKTMKEAITKINYIQRSGNIYLRGGSIAFLIIESNLGSHNSDGVLFFDFKSIEKDIDTYIPLFYERLMNSLTIYNEQNRFTGTINTSRSHNADYSGKSVAFTSEDISKNNLMLLKSIYNDVNSKCAFILGNGVSIPFGSDSWERLISNLIDYLSPFYIKNADGIIKELSKSNYLISSFVKSTFEEKGQESVFIDGLKYCIYRKFNSEMLKDNSLLKAIALAKINKPDLAILTYNYDTFLEQQITECNPSLQYKSYSGRYYAKHFSDSIIHLHGTIKSDSDRIDKTLVLTDKDYFNAYLSKKNSWVCKAQEDILSNYNCLFIGSSMSDLFQLSIIEKVFENRNHDWKCFALMCFKKELGDNDKNNLMKFYKNKGVYIIFVDEHSNLSSILNSITGNSFPTNKSYSP